MGSFWSAIGSGLEDYAKQRAQRSPLGRAITGAQQRYRPQTSASNQMDRSPVPDSLGGSSPTVNATPLMQDDQGGPAAPAQMQAPEQNPAGPSDDLAGLMPDLMGGGKIVTRPTTAVIGEHGPEMVLPMNSNPYNKVSAPLLDQPGMSSGGRELGQGGVRTRSRHVSGPQALGRYRPISADLPLRPNSAPR